MRKIYTLIILLISFLFVSAQVVPNATESDCNSNTEDLYSHLNAGKVMIVAFQGFDCPGCNANAIKVDTFATNHSASIHVWAALSNIGGGGTCDSVTSWKGRHGYSNVFSFLDDDITWTNNYPGTEFIVIHPNTKEVVYSSYTVENVLNAARILADTATLPNAIADIFFDDSKIYVGNNSVLHLSFKEAIEGEVKIFNLQGKLSFKSNFSGTEFSTKTDAIGLNVISITDRYGNKVTKKVWFNPQY